MARDNRAHLATADNRRSPKKSGAAEKSAGVPNPLLLRYRVYLAEAVGLVVRDRKSAQAAAEELGLTESTAPGFQAILLDQLKTLQVFNYARFRVTLDETQAWINAGLRINSRWEFLAPEKSIAVALIDWNYRPVHLELVWHIGALRHVLQA